MIKRQTEDCDFQKCGGIRGRHWFIMMNLRMYMKMRGFMELAWLYYQLTLLTRNVRQKFQKLFLDVLKECVLVCEAAPQSNVNAIGKPWCAKAGEPLVYESAKWSPDWSQKPIKRKKLHFPPEKVNSRRSIGCRQRILLLPSQRTTGRARGADREAYVLPVGATKVLD